MAFLEFERDLLKKRINELTGNRTEGIAKSRAARDTVKQRMAGGAGLGAGAATTGADVNSGTGVKEPVTSQQMLAEQNLGMADTVQEATAGAMKLGQNMTTASEMMRDQERGMFGPDINRLPSPGEPTTLGGGSLARADEGNATIFDRTNTQNSKGTFSTYEAPDYEGALSAMRDLRDYKLQRGAYEQEDRPMTVIGGYKSYSDDIAAYNAGDVGSEGYNRIRNERMQLQRQIDDATRGVSSSKAKAAIREKILGTFSEQQKARLAGEIDIQQANIAAGADQYKAGLEAQSDAAARQQDAFFKSAGLEKEYAAIERQREADIANQNLNAARLGFDQAKEAEGIRQFETRYGEGGLEQQRLEIDAGKEVVSAQSRSINDRIKQAEAELAAYKGAGELGEVDPKIRREIMRRNGLLDYEPTEE